jgi:hypothetical protein
MRPSKLAVVGAALAAGCALTGCGVGQGGPGLVDSATTTVVATATAGAAAPTTTAVGAGAVPSTTGAVPSTTGAVPLTTGQTGPGGQALSFRSMTIRLRASWRSGGGGDQVTVAFSQACRRSAGGIDCPGFLLLGPSQIAVADELGPYDPARPWHPGTGVEGCPMDRDGLYESGSRLRKGGFAKVGGRDAVYREWRIACVDARTGKPKTGYLQRIWHLPRSQILVVDEWSTPGLAEVLAGASFG